MPGPSLKVSLSIYLIVCRVRNLRQPASRSNNGDCEDDMVEVYEGIRGYVGIAENIKDEVRNLVAAIGESLPSLPVGVESVIPNPDDDLKRV